MMPKKSLTALSIASAVLMTAVLPATSAAALTPQDTVKLRHENFEKMGKAMKALTGQLKSSSPSKPVMSAAAQTLAATARQQGALFPAGTGPGQVKTDALAAIWTDRATFDGQMNKLVGESSKLVGVVNTGDVSAITAQAKATGAVCGACHRQFRHDDD